MQSSISQPVLGQLMSDLAINWCLVIPVCPSYKLCRNESLRTGAMMTIEPFGSKLLSYISSSFMSQYL